MELSRIVRQFVLENWKTDFNLFREYYLADNRVDYVPSGDHHIQWGGILQGDLTQLSYDSEKKEDNFDPKTVVLNTEGKINRKIVIQAPREHAKSTQFTVDYVIWELYKNPDLRIAIVSSVKSVASSFLREIQSQLESNELLKSDLGSLVPKRPDKWSESEIIVKRKALYKDPSIAAIGANGAILSKRCDLLILDDILNPDNVKTEDQRQKTKDWFGKVLYPILVPDGKLIVIGTIFHEDDFLVNCMNDETFSIRLRYKAILDEETQEVLWPERHSFESLEEKRKSIGGIAFKMAYQNEVFDSETAVIKRIWVNRAVEKGKLFTLEDNWHYNTNPFGRLLITAGVDLQSSTSSKADNFAIVVLGINIETKIRIPLWVVRKKGLSMSQQEEEIKKVARMFNPDSIFVESNGYQQMLIRDMNEETDLPIKSFNTTSEKNDPVMGVNSIGVLLENEKFILVTKSDNIEVAEAMRYLIDGMVLYNPNKHVEDTLMALWFANVAGRALLSQYDNPVGSIKTVNTIYQNKIYERKNSEPSKIIV